MKVIPFGKIGDFVTSELIISDNYNMIVDYNPPYKKEVKDDKYSKSQCKD